MIHRKVTVQREALTDLCTCLNFKPETDETWQDLAQTYTDQTGVDVRVVTAADGQYDTTLQSVSKSILILAKGTSNMLFSNIIEAVQVILGKSDYTLRVNYLDEEANEVSEAIRVCREHKPMGILFLGSNAEYFKEQFAQVHVPCVLVTDRGDELEFDNLASVSTDDVAAAEMAVDYLFEHGHRHIAVIGGDLENSSPSSHRKMGCVNSFKKYGCEFDEAYYGKARFLMRVRTMQCSSCFPKSFRLQQYLQ